MGFQFRKSIKIGKHLKINLSKSGIGFSWGVKGFRLSRSASGKTKATVSIPGTGISYSTPLDGKKTAKKTTKKKKTTNKIVEADMEAPGEEMVD